ncbi:MAG TPA: MBL fold metallo-hydrolase [Bacillota bacterium]|nr:MBL fold metallo-hydrolase [Bacillota bacterium]HOL08548.1 MBL fold metallo-hydrolase [Bacillota bacterium]HPO96971.1 MBL fold metallo-hydrolase [Bacillota bacterium]
MQITFCGAAETVTGSCFLITTKQAKFIIDCGMFQGNKEIRHLNFQDFPFNPTELDFVLLTHAHIDHSGLLPKLVQLGFANPIYATKATVELCKISLPDSGHIQQMEAEWRNRKRLRQGLEPEEPLYTVNDALVALRHFVSKDYHELFEPVPGIKVNFLDAGHILGSALIEIWVTEDGATTKLVFSGDLGQKNQPIIRDPSYVRDADYIIIESTYGNRLHEEHHNKVDLLKKIILDTISAGGNLIIPSFAIGRTQDLLYHIKNLLLAGQLPRIPVYIDSPMAVSVTEIYHDHPGYYDDETLAMLRSGENPFEFSDLHFVKTAEDSKQLNQIAKGAIIISPSGMCEAGRILHHLKHNLWRSDSHILFVGYQAEGTLGRRLLEGAKVVKIMGEEVNVQAIIHSIDGFSAHADQNGLIDWLSGFEQRVKGIFIVHGERQSQQEFATLIRRKFGVDPVIPKLGESFVLDEAAHRTVDSVEQLLHTKNYVLERTASDLEHLVLLFRNKIRKADYVNSEIQLEEIKQLIVELENKLKTTS